MGVEGTGILADLSTRPATPLDIDWMIPELRIFSRHYGTKLQLFGEEAYVRKVLAQAIDAHPFFVCEKAGTPAGFMAGQCSPHPWNPEILVFSELLWWVREVDRFSGVGATLLARFVEEGDRLHADWVVMSLAATCEVNRQSLTRKGFQLQEFRWLKENVA